MTKAPDLKLIEGSDKIGMGPWIDRAVELYVHGKLKGLAIVMIDDEGYSTSNAISQDGCNRHALMGLLGCLLAEMQNDFING